MLYNAGYLEALRDDYWDCFVFHDFAVLGRHVLDRAAF